MISELQPTANLNLRSIVNNGSLKFSILSNKSFVDFTVPEKSTSGYTPAESGDISYLRIVSPPGYELPATTYVFTYKNPDSCRGRYNLQDFKWVDKSSFSYVKINSGKTFALSLQPFWLGHNVGRGCHVGLAFTPQKNHYYTVVLKAKREDDYCYLSVLSSVDPNGELIVVPTERKVMGGPLLMKIAAFVSNVENEYLLFL